MEKKKITPREYVESLPDGRREAVDKFRKLINKNLPKGFQEDTSYGWLGWVVPHKLYPAGYHCDPSTPLPFLGLASQKNHIALYHMGLYADPGLLGWFTAQWAKATPRKLDMGKSCIRFKKPDEIPFDLIGELAGKVSPADWIRTYEAAMKR